MTWSRDIPLNWQSSHKSRNLMTVTFSSIGTPFCKLRGPLTTFPVHPEHTVLTPLLTRSYSLEMAVKGNPGLTKQTGHCLALYLWKPNSFWLCLSKIGHDNDAQSRLWDRSWATASGGINRLEDQARGISEELRIKIWNALKEAPRSHRIPLADNMASA